MADNNVKYVELAIGSVSNRAYAIRPEHITKYIKPNQELYRSLFILDKSAFEHFRDKGSIKSYKGTYALNTVIFDIDRGKKTGQDTKQRALSFYETLLEQGLEDDQIHIWFSGRGFHIEIPNLYGFVPSENLPYQVKMTIDSHFGKLVDNIYDKGRLIRVGYTINMKSELYKLPLSWKMLNDMTYLEICEYCQTQKQDYNHKPFDENQITIWEDKVLDVKEFKEENNADVSNTNLNAHVTCVQKMWKSDKEGERHITLLRMANGWRRMGIQKEGAIKMSEYNIPSLDHNEILKIIDDVYAWEHNGYSCSDTIMEKYCDPICKFYKNKNYGLEVLNVKELSSKLRDFVHMDMDTNSFNLKDYYPMNTDYRFLPGELAILLGDTKLGKTAWLQSLMVKLSHMNVMYLSLEVGDWLIFRRFLQAGNGITKQEVNETYRIYDEDRVNKINDKVKHIKVMTTSPDIDSMKQLIADNQPQIVCIDTIDAIEVKYNNDPFTKMEKIVNSLKQIATQMDVIFFGISHISKGASRDMLTVHSAKGNSAIEQKADKILGIQGQRDANNIRVIRSLASRDETDFEMAFDFDYKTFQFKPRSI
ncbi:MAG: hypothetical protein CMD28_02065 [Flavobacteriales bacterium]|nr:hypothetical protein [Flavobacteriales bacterium]